MRLFIFLFMVIAVPLYAQEADTLLTPTQSPASLRSQQHMIRGMTRALQGDHEEAITEYQKALEFQPKESNILLGLAESYSELGDFSTALYFAKEALSINPNSFEVHRMLAVIFEKAGNPEEAISTLETYLTNHNKDQFGWETLIELELRNSKQEALAKSLTTFIDVFSPFSYFRFEEVNSSAIQLLATTFQTLGQFENHLKTLERIHHLTPHDKENLSQLIALYTANNQHQQAIDALEETASVLPNDSEISFWLSTLRDNDTSSPTTLSLEQYTVEALERQAFLLFEKRNEEQSRTQAILFLDELLQRKPTHVDALLAKSTLFYEAGNFQEAAQLYESITRKSAKSIEAWVGAITSYTLAQNPEKALNLAEEAAFLFAGVLPVMLAKTSALIELGRLDEAKTLLLEATTIWEEDAPDDTKINATILALEGDIFAKEGNVSQAKSKWLEALDLDPTRKELQNKIDS